MFLPYSKAYGVSSYSDPAGGLVAAFAWGGLLYVLGDALTVSGVPFADDRAAVICRFSELGGKV